METRISKPVTTENHIPIVKLTGRNIEAWKQSLFSYLCLMKLKPYIEKSHEGDTVPEDELRARMAILSSLDETAQEKVQGCVSAFNMFQRIITIYSSGQADNADYLLRKLFSMKKESSDSMTEHFTKMDAVRMCLERIGTPIDNRIFMNQVILSLPAEYSVMADIWDSLPAAEKTVNRLLATICREESKQKDSIDSEAKALAARKMSLKERKRITNCAKCGLKGHWAKECETRPEDYVKKSTDQGGRSKNDYAL